MRAVLKIFLVLFSVFVRQKVAITENITFADCVRNPASGLLQIGQKSKKWPWRHNFPTWHQHQIFGRCFVSLVKFSNWSKFHVNIITGSGITTIFFYKGLTKIRKSEIPSSEFCPISGDWDELWVPNLARMSVTECYWILRNSRITVSTVLELLRENQLGVTRLWRHKIWS